jgi:hypothetical protein
MHRTTRRFWEYFSDLPEPTQRVEVALAGYVFAENLATP